VIENNRNLREAPTEPSTESPTKEPEIMMNTGPPAEKPTEYIYRCSVHGPVEPVTVSGRLICPICRRFLSKQPIEGEGGIGVGELEDEEVEQLEEEKEVPELAPLKPTEVSATERVRELLAKNLGRVYGIPKQEASKRITAILDTLNPDVALSPQSLHAHIKRYAPNADDQHLQSIINNIFWNLRNEGYLPSQYPVPIYASPPGVAPPVIYQSPYSQPTPQPIYTPQIYPYQAFTPPYGPTSSPYSPSSYPMPSQGAGSGRRMKIVIEGQEIETDFEGFMAWRRYQQDVEREKREWEIHDLEMKKLEEELKGIAGERGETKESLVPVKFGETTVNVPASIAPLYLAPKTEKEATIPIKIEDSVVNVPASIAPLFLRKEQLIPVEVRGQTIQVPASLAPLYLKGEDETVKKLGDEVKDLRETLHQKELESRDKELGSLREDLKSVRDRMEKQPTLEEQLDALDRYAESRGYTKTGRTTLDVVGEGVERLDGTFRELVQRLTPSGGGAEFKPEVRRTPEERLRKAQEIEGRLEENRELMEAEEDLIHSAKEVLRSSTTSR